MHLKRFYKGEIVSIDDPKKLWRIKVDIKGLFSTPNGDQRDIDISELPFIYPMNNGFNSGETPKVGQSVLVEFDDGDIRKGRYRSWEEMSDEFTTMLNEDYEGYKSLVYDSEEKLNIRYSRKNGVEIILDKSYVQIKPDGVIKNSFNNGERIIEINAKGVSTKSDKIFHGSINEASEPCVMGDVNASQLKALWDAINNINNNLSKFGLTQTLVSKGVLSPLKAGFKILEASSKKEISPNEKTKSDVPKTLSKVNKLN